MRSNLGWATALLVSLLAMPATAEEKRECVSDCGCPAGEVCGANGGTTRCEAGACPADYKPVCGLDGKTYSNACNAGLQRVGVAYEGECKTAEARTCGGIAGVACCEGSYCEYAIGTCRQPDVQGTCRTIPGICPEVEDPVCGCDGKTYGNACKAAAAGQSLLCDQACADCF
jgi:hypothetical protein